MGGDSSGPRKSCIRCTSVFHLRKGPFGGCLPIEISICIAIAMQRDQCIGLLCKTERTFRPTFAQYICENLLASEVDIYSSLRDRNWYLREIF